MANVLSFGAFSLFPAERRLERNGEIVKLGSRALDILIALVEHAGEVISKEDLTARVWPDTVVEESGLRVHIAGLRKALGDGRDGARYVANVPGRGYCFVASLARSATTPPAPAPLQATNAPRQALPSKPARIIGRDSEIAQVGNQLLLSRFVSVVGPGGMGKTTVAIAVAHELAAEFAGDICFVEFGSVTDARQAPAAFAAGLGPISPGPEPAESFVAFLRERRTLIILDSCEHVLEAIATIAERIIRDAPAVHILATSREPLRVEGETVHRLAPLDAPPDGDDITATRALTFPAVQLFVERAAAGGARLVLTDEEAPVVANICRRLDGIALAIEFAASRVDAYGIRGTASLLENRFKLIWHGRRTALPRHQTLSALLDWSYNLLDDAERKILRQLSVFVGSFSLEDGASVAADRDVDEERVVDILGSLVEKSLISVDADGTALRYRLLDTTREYAQTKLDEANERAAISRRLASHLCAVLEQERGDPLAEHLGNVRAALEWSFSENGDAILGRRLAAAAAPLFMKVSLLAECERWTEIAIGKLDQSERETHREMNLQVALAVSQMFTHANSPEVRAALTRGLAMAEALDDPEEQLRVLGALNLLLTRIGEFREALLVGERSELVADRLNDPAVRHIADWMVGTCQHLLGDQIEAEKWCRTALDRPARSPRTALLHFGFDHRIRALIVMARTLWLRGRADEAVQVANQTIREAEEIGQPTTMAIALIYCSSVFTWRGEWNKAGELVERLAKHATKYSLGPYKNVALGLKGELAVKRGDASGVQLLRRALETLHAERHELFHTIFATAIAEGLASVGQFTEALTTLEGAIAATTARNGTSFDLPEMLRVKARLLSSMPSPNVAEAERCLIRAIDCAKGQSAIGWQERAEADLARLRAL